MKPSEFLKEYKFPEECKESTIGDKIMEELDKRFMDREEVMKILCETVPKIIAYEGMKESGLLGDKNK